MAKKQSFASKLKKGGDAHFKVVKMVFSYQSKDSGSWRFAERIVKVPVEGDEAKAVEAELNASLAFVENGK